MANHTYCAYSDYCCTSEDGSGCHSAWDWGTSTANRTNWNWNCGSNINHCILNDAVDKGAYELKAD